MPGDSLWDKVPLLLHCDGTDGSTTILNSGNSSLTPSLTIAPIASPNLSTTLPKYGTASLRLIGASSKYLRLDGFDTTSTFTFECNIKIDSLPASGSIQPIFTLGTLGSNTNRLQAAIVASGSVTLYTENFNSSILYNFGTDVSTIAINTWYHLAFVIDRSLGFGYIYVNGVLKASAILFSGDYTFANTFIGYGRSSSTNNFLTGNLDEVRITTDLRYTSGFSAITAPFVEYGEYSKTQSDSIVTTSNQIFSFNKEESEALSVATSQDSSILCTFLDELKVNKTLISSANSKNYLLEYISSLDNILCNFYGSVTEMYAISSTLLNIKDQIQLIESSIEAVSLLSHDTIFKESIVNIVRLIASLDKALYSEVLDQIVISDMISLLYSLYNKILESAILSDILSKEYATFLAIEEESLFDDFTNSKLTAEAIASNSLIFSIKDEKSNKYLAYLLSPETNSVSTYNNYNFNGCTKFGYKYLFYNRTGLYEYGGATDNGSPILSEIETVAFNFNTSNLKQVPSIYLGVDSTDKVILKVRVDGKAEVHYQLNKFTNNLMTQKIDIGKGLIGRYFQFELITEASEFNMESIEFYPLEIRRKL